MIPFLPPTPWHGLPQPSPSLPASVRADLTALSEFYLQELRQEAEPHWIQPRFSHPTAQRIAEALRCQTHQFQQQIEQRLPAATPTCLPPDLTPAERHFLSRWLQLRQQAFHPLEPADDSALSAWLQTPYPYSVAEPVPTYLGVLSYLQPQYEEAVAEGLKQLQRAFLHHYQQSRFPAFEKDTLLLQLCQLLSPQQAIEGGIWPLTTRQIDQLRQEIKLITPVYQLETLLQRRSLHELQERTQGPFFETEAYLHFYSWLKSSSLSEGEIQRILATRNPDSNHPIRWRSLRPLPELSLLHRELGDLLVGDPSFETFYAHFTQPDQARLRWRGSQVLLMYLFDRLRTIRLLPGFSQKGMAETIAEHFCKADGQAFKPKSLEASYSRLSQPPKHHERIDHLIEALSARSQAGTS